MAKADTEELVLYLSDGEEPAVMRFVDLAENLTNTLEGADSAELAGLGSVEELISDIAGATDWRFAQGFWHGLIGNYNVAVIDMAMLLHLIKESRYEHG